MAEVIPFGEPENESERMAIVYLRQHLPPHYKLFTNLEIKQGLEIFEIDFILLGDKCVFVVDVKNWHGRIEIIGSSWHPERHQSHPSPLKKLRKHAKVLSSMICEGNRAIPDLQQVHVQAAVLMTADDVFVDDQSGMDGDHVTYLDKRCLSYFQGNAHIPLSRLNNIQRYVPLVDRILRGKARSKTSVRRYRDWQVEEELGKDEIQGYTEYRAKNLMLGAGGWTARIRVYEVDPFLSLDERDAEQKLIQNGFKAVLQIPVHSNILSVRDFFAHEGDSFVLVTEDIPGQALRQHIKKQDLNLEQKLVILRGVLHGLDHAHKHGVIHRNITPDTILIAADGQVKLTGFDYARISSNNSTIAQDIAEDLEEYAIYQAIECQNNPSQASVTSDLFSAGLVFYELLTGAPAFESVDQMHTQKAVFLSRASDRTPDLPSDIDYWLQKLCAYNSSDRFTNAYAALDALAPLATLPTIDITNLPTDHILDDRYRVMRRLGRPGSFAVAYQVFDTLDETVQVIKLVTRDRRSVYERLQQEYRTLRRVPKHPHVVETIWAGKLGDGTPFILFDYVDGQDVEHLIESKALPLDQAISIAHQTAVGLAHLHQHQVRHQDIKPSNLLLTNEGIRIIDFNVAVIDSDETTISAGTRRYMPPDFRPSLNSNTAEKVDRDLYALGIVFYECVTGHYPFEEPHPPIGKAALPPTQFEGCADLDESLISLLLKAIAPSRSDRFTSAEELIEAIDQLPGLKKGVEQAVIIEPSIEAESVAIAEPIKKGEALPAIAETPPAPPSLPEIVEPSLDVPALDEAIEAQEDSLPLPQVISSPPTVNVDLFESLAVESITPDLTHPIVLDPTGIYPIPLGYIAITNEVEWMCLFGLSASPYWVKGKRLCDWSIEWLRLRGREEEIKIKQDPRPKLESLFHPIALPSEWNNAQLLALSNKLDEYPTDNSIAHFLADVTGSDLQIWLSTPDLQHLAAWLAIQVPAQYEIFEQVWLQNLPAHDLTRYYQADKRSTLRRWLGIAQPALTKLEPYPLLIPEWITEEFDQFWQQAIYRSDGAILDDLILAHQPGKERIAIQAYDALNNRPTLITKARETKVSPYLSSKQRSHLSDRFPPDQPDPLTSNATSQQALEWAKSYLQFRRWEIVVKQTAPDERVSDRLADSFVEWLLKHYPALKEEFAGDSILNYSVPSLIRHYCQSSPVLWVVVDGLGWLDHQELLSYLTQQQLSLEVALQPRLSILPTKTEYAKWSLYSQLLPRDSSWVPDAGKGFSKLGIGERYTDNQKAELLRDLRSGKHQLYCWDTTTFDELFHTARDWKHLYKVERPATLRAIAEEIKSFIHEFPKPDQLRVVIATDHGQMLGESSQLTHRPPELEVKGRVAIGKTDDPRFVVLARDRYGLPHDLSIVRSSASFGSYSYTTDKSIIGSHGGLFPEEVVVGVSVLRESVKRNPVLINCKGEGEARKPGTLEIEIDNPNTVELVDLCLRIKELPTLKAGLSLTKSVPANQKVSLSLPIPEYPERPPNQESDRLSLSGELAFRFANAELGNTLLDAASAIKVHQIFSSGLDIDEFL